MNPVLMHPSLTICLSFSSKLNLILRLDQISEGSKVSGMENLHIRRPKIIWLIEVSENDLLKVTRITVGGTSKSRQGWWINTIMNIWYKPSIHLVHQFIINHCSNSILLDHKLKPIWISYISCLRKKGWWSATADQTVWVMLTYNLSLYIFVFR